MNHFKKIALFIVVTGIILACNFSIGPTTQPENVSTIVAATLQNISSATPVTAQATSTAAPQGIPVTYFNVSFVIPDGLASTALTQTIPPTDEQTSGPWAVAPQHLEFQLNDYNLPAGHFSEILIDVYPAQDYANAYSGANISLQRLRALLSNPSTLPTNENLPQVPYFNAASMFAAKIKPIQFKNGSGFRMITQYGQGVGPIANNGTFYHFEGLTGDGKYYVVAVLPIEAKFLANGNDPAAPVPVDGVPFPGYNNTDPVNFENYFKAVADKMNTTPDESFSPSLVVLDSLIQSFQITQ
jgi:hypothetical protein